MELDLHALKSPQVARSLAETAAQDIPRNLGDGRSSLVTSPYIEKVAVRLFPALPRQGSPQWAAAVAGT
jgi:hypothetical protein